jgi:pyruvate formate lyase activating enzyme
MGFLIKLDTNGVYTDRLVRLIDEKLLDYIAMDEKFRGKVPFDRRRSGF